MSELENKTAASSLRHYVMPGTDMYMPGTDMYGTDMYHDLVTTRTGWLHTVRVGVVANGRDSMKSRYSDPKFHVIVGP